MPGDAAQEPRPACAPSHIDRTLLERERRRIARDIHDHVGQPLAYLNLGLHALRLKVPKVADEEFLARMIESVREINDQIHDIIYEIRNESREPADRVSAIESSARSWQAKNSIPLELFIDECIRMKPMLLNPVFFNVFRETLANISKHALTATRVSAKLSIVGNVVELNVTDDGPGLPGALLSRTDAESRDARQFGLMGIREALEEIGGSLRIVSEPGAGTSVSACIPLGDACDDGEV